MKNLIVFDIDGTLTDSVEIHQKAFKETLHEIGVKEIKKEFKKFKHHTDSYIVKEIYEQETNEKFIDSKFVEFEKGLNDKICKNVISEINGAKKLIESLNKNSDFGFCFATGSLLRPAIHKLNSIGVNYHEELLIASDKIYSREEIVSQAIKNAERHYGVKSFKRIISVGDGLWDLLAAKNLNIEFIGIGEKNKNLFKENGARIVLNDLTQFEL